MLTTKDQIIQQLDALTPEQQQQVLDFARGLSSALPMGIPGEVLAARARELNFNPDDVADMMRAIDEACE